MSLKNELQSIISGNGSVRNGKIIQTITRELRRKKKAISAPEKAKFNKEPLLSEKKNHDVYKT